MTCKVHILSIQYLFFRLFDRIHHKDKFCNLCSIDKNVFFIIINNITENSIGGFMQMHFRKNGSKKISRMKTRTFTLIKLLMRKSYESGISFCRQQDRAGCCQSPDLLSSFFIPLLNCSNVSPFLLPSMFLVLLFLLPG